MTATEAQAAKLDVSGCVARPPTEHGHADGWVSWADLDAFTQGYVEAMFASTYGRPERNETFAAMGHGFSDLAPETLTRIIADCAEVLALAAHAHMNTAAAGREFWERRQAGRYDTKIAGPLAPYLGDDGLIRLSPTLTQHDSQGEA